MMMAVWINELSDAMLCYAMIISSIRFMENGSLASVVKKFGFLQEPVIAIYTTQVLQGLKYLHEQGVLHRDIKGANILLSKDGYGVDHRNPSLSLFSSLLSSSSSSSSLLHHLHFTS